VLIPVSIAKLECFDGGGASPNRSRLIRCPRLDYSARLFIIINQDQLQSFLMLKHRNLTHVSSLAQARRTLTSMDRNPYRRPMVLVQGIPPCWHIKLDHDHSTRRAWSHDMREALQSRHQARNCFEDGIYQIYSWDDSKLRIIGRGGKARASGASPKEVSELLAGPPCHHVIDCCRFITRPSRHPN